MKSLSFISFANIKKFFAARLAVAKKIPWMIAYHAFLSLLVCVIIEVLIGELLFYKYAISAIIEDPVIAENSIIFKEPVYQAVVTEWEKRKTVAQDTSLENSPNPFE